LNPWPLSSPGSRASALDAADGGAALDLGADLGLQGGDGAGPVGGQGLLHLHRLQDDDQVAGLDLLAVLDRDLDDHPLHGGDQGVLTGGVGPAPRGGGGGGGGGGRGGPERRGGRRGG